MMMSLSSLITFCLLLLLSIHGTLGQKDCKCGGKYANGKSVSSCSNDKCSTAGSNSRCVVISRVGDQSQTPIGYDCVAWPTHVADCATFDDGSRVCASDVCRPTLLGGEKGECAKQDDDGHHVLLAAQVNRAGLDFVMNAVKHQAELQVKKLLVPNQKLQQSGFDVTVTDVKITEFVSPTFAYTLLPPSSIKITVKGGDFKVCAKWDAKKSIINPGGDICVWSQQHQGVDVEVTAKMQVNELGQLSLATSDCKIKVPIDMKLTGAVGTMVNIVSGWIENMVESQANTQVCKVLDDAVKTTVTGLLDELPKTFKIDARYGVSYGFRSLSFHDGGVRAQIAANGTFAQA